MRRRTALVLAVVGFLPALAVNAHAAGPTAQAAMSVPTDQASRVGRFLSASPHAALPVKGASVSLNWAGWVVPGSNITGVQSTFTVPTAKLTPPGFSVSWAGIGGYSTSDLIQAGTQSDSAAVGGLPRYYAWYEILPDAERRLVNCSGDANCTVQPGNRMSVNIHLVGTNLWSVSVVNSGRWTWQSNVSYHSSLSSAEWILEAPTVGGQTTIADVNSAYFGTVSKFTSVGTYALGQARRVKVNLGVVEARTSALAPNGQSFRVCTYALRCPAPSS